MTSDTDESDTKPPSPDDAFSALGDETRMAILQTLGEVDTPLSFSELREHIGISDADQLTYHLDQLTGLFIRKTDDGYDLLQAGYLVIEAVLSAAKNAAEDNVEETGKVFDESETALAERMKRVSDQLMRVRESVVNAPDDLLESPSPPEVGESPTEMNYRIDMDEAVYLANRRIDTLNRYLMRKTLKDEIRFFTDIADRFEDHDPEASRLAYNIVEKAEDAIREEVYTDPEEYRTCAGQKLEDHLDLEEVLEDSATEETLERYVKAVSDLQTALAEDADITRIAEAQDGICEAADSLEELYDAAPGFAHEDTLIEQTMNGEEAAEIYAPIYKSVTGTGAVVGGLATVMAIVLGSILLAAVSLLATAFLVFAFRREVGGGE